jgi:hypothetical protein
MNLCSGKPASIGTILFVSLFIVFAESLSSPGFARQYIYISTSEQGVQKYIANVRCSPLPQIRVAKACIFWDLLVEPNGRRNEMEMMLVCDNYSFAPRAGGVPGQIARAGSLMAIAASRMC